MRPPVWTLLCGQIRDSASAIHQAHEIARLKHAGLLDGVVVSVWRGELDRRQDVREAFAGIDAIVVEADPPLLKAPGHVLHQAVSIRRALDECPDDAVVFRARPDLGQINTLFDGVLSLDWMAQHQARSSSPASAPPIWVHSGLFPWPLYLSDILFGGFKSDVSRLIDVDIKQESLFSNLAPEQFFHLGPMLKVDAVFAMFGQLQPSSGPPEANAQAFKILWKSPFWAQVLKRTARRLADTYVVGFAPAERAWSEEILAGYADVSLTDLTKPACRAPQFEWLSNVGAPVFHSTGWAHALLDGRFLRDAAWDRFQAANEDASPEALFESAARLSHTLNAVPGYSNTWPNRQGRSVVFGTNPTRLETQKQADDRIPDLEDELSATRRRLDDANAELSALRRERLTESTGLPPFRRLWRRLWSRRT